MKLPDGTRYFNNVGEPPIGWTAEVTGDVITTSAYGTFTWDDEERCYRDGEKRLYIYPNGNFAIIEVPDLVIVGTWS